MLHPLDGCRAKLTRAEETRTLLDAEIRAFIKSSAPVMEVKLHKGRHWLSIGKVTPPPLRFSVLAGDVLYDLRSCLDHLVHQLIVAHTGREPNHRTYDFPVCCTRPEFEKSLPRKLKDVSSRAIALIADVQPFNFEHPRHTSLFTLHELHLVDKHRLPLSGVVSGRVHSVMASNEDTELLWSGGGFQGIVKEGTQLAVLDPFHAEMQVNAFITYDVALTDISQRVSEIPLARMLGMIHRVVVQILAHVGQALEPEAPAATRRKPRRRPSSQKR